MISRVAESCFWFERYIERADSVARLLRVTRSFTLDLDLETFERWYPLIVVAGEEEPFLRSHDRAEGTDGDVVQEYLTWESECPVSIVSSTRWARENARMIREVLSHELWATLNTFWHWLRGGSGRRTYRRDRDAFYHRVEETADLLHGLSHDTMLHEEPFDFMRLGMLLERAAQTARILDVKHHAFGGERDVHESAVENAQWSALLECCGATETFVKRTRGVFSGRAVAEFLIMEPLFPRSIYHCLDRAWNFLRRVRPSQRSRIGRESSALLEGLLDRLRSQTVDEVFASGIHGELTHIIDRTADVCSAIHRDYFDPQMPANGTDETEIFGGVSGGAEPS